MQDLLLLINADLNYLPGWTDSSKRAPKENSLVFPNEFRTKQINPGFCGLTNHVLQQGSCQNNEENVKILRVVGNQSKEWNSWALLSPDSLLVTPGPWIWDFPTQIHHLPTSKWTGSFSTMKIIFFLISCMWFIPAGDVCVPSPLHGHHSKHRLNPSQPRPGLFWQRPPSVTY